jgi:hypothetical protein
VDFSSNDYIVTSPATASENKIIIYDGSNDTFSISVNDQYAEINGLTTIGRDYDVNIKIPSYPKDPGSNGKSYSVNDLILVINKQLLANPITEKSSVSTITKIDGQNYVKFNFILNKVFSTQDYKLVFYDPYSYVKCFSSSVNGSNSAQNVTWDSTLGWILGYRNSIEYIMSDYTSIIYPSTGLATQAEPAMYYYSDISNTFVIYGDTSVSTNLYNYFLIILDDYVQNHLNDGLVTITSHETSTDPGPYVYACDPVNPSTKIAVPADYGSPGVTYTQQELQAFNQRVKSQITQARSYSSGPFVQDIFGIIPVKTTGMAIGSAYIEFGGSLQLQQRLYFGPVNIHRMTIRLLTDRGNTLDLNGANWSFSLVCEQLYKNGIS